MRAPDFFSFLIVNNLSFVRPLKCVLKNIKINIDSKECWFWYTALQNLQLRTHGHDSFLEKPHMIYTLGNGGYSNGNGNGGYSNGNGNGNGGYSNGNGNGNGGYSNRNGNENGGHSNGNGNGGYSNGNGNGNGGYSNGNGNGGYSNGNGNGSNGYSNGNGASSVPSSQYAPPPAF